VGEGYRVSYRRTVGCRIVTVIDTHVWVWHESNPEKLSKRATSAIREADSIGICAISCWEIPMLVEKAKLKLDRDVLVWLKQALARPRTVLLPITPEIGVASSTLGPDFHGDPADRLIAATTLLHRGELVTKDRRLRDVARIPTVW
jgi:PIN domain nuclease of toxin-antitoxin system